MRNIVFITKRVHNISFRTLDNTKELEDFLSNQTQVGYDKEFNGLDAYTCIPLLTSIGNKEIQYVIDDTSIDISFLNKYKNLLYIGHNIKIDYKVSKIQKFQFRNIWDTMIVEQRLGLGSGRGNTLDATLSRRLQINLKKDTRDEFKKMDRNSIFSDRHIEYAAEDIEHLEQLIEVQRDFIGRYNIEHLIYNIEFPLVTVLGDSELVGIKINETKWLEGINENKEKKFKLELELDEEIRRLLGDKVSVNKIYRTVRKRQRIEYLDLFGESLIKENTNSNSLNYGSSDQIIELFRVLGEKIPEIKKKQSKGEAKVLTESVGEDSLIQYKIKNEESIMIPFINKLLELRKVDKELSTYGDKFLKSHVRKGTKLQKGFKSNVTGKVHTINKQCFTSTGRLSSGSKDEGYFNSQNIPKKERYRNAFIADPGKLLTKCDLSGAELVLGASLSGDKRLIELILNDPHSPLATVSYNSVIEHIISKYQKTTAIERLEELLNPDKEFLKITNDQYQILKKERALIAYENRGFTITKETANDLRETFKSVVYGLCYGASADRIAEVLNISKAYATLIEKAIKKELPVFFEYLDKKSKYGLKNGFVLFNTRTNSRRWFPKALKAIETGKEISFSSKGEIERESKNSPIQGSQSDMIKESIVRFFYEYVYPNNLDIDLIFNVHDELLIQHPEDDLESPKMLAKIMNETANLYLIEGLKMKSEYKTGKHWIK